MTDTTAAAKPPDGAAVKPDVVTIAVNGRDVTARPGELVIAAAERNGTYIPRFCYHPRMSSVGMCRMCIVEIDTGRGPSLQPACMIPVADGMKVETESPVTKKAQDGVLEFLLINHPLDCPVCDRGGECPLQDQTMAFGPGESRFVEEKRHFEKPIPISQLVNLDRERCILCDRCTRFSREVADDPLISFFDRGNTTQVNTFPDHPFASYFSGNTVQICPVGALTATPYRFRARPWDLEQVESTCTSCAVGCRMAVQSSVDQLVRNLGVDVNPVNWGWLCDKGRFDYEAFNQDDRITAPLRRQGDDLVEATWSEAVRTAAEGLRQGTVAVLGGARLANEDAYAWSKLARTVLKTDHVDCQLGDGLPADVVLGLPRATIDRAMRADTIVLLTGDLKEELPVLFLRVRDAVSRHGVSLVELSPTETSLTRYAAASLRYRPGEAAALVRSLAVTGNAADAVATKARDLLGGGQVVCIIGRPSLAESAESIADAAEALMAAVPGVTFLSGLRRGNVHGALDMGLAPGLLPGRVRLEEGRHWFGEWGELPAERGMDCTAILTAAAGGRLDGLVLLGADPLSDFPDRDLARRALAGARFVLAVDCLPTDSVAQADIVLPAAGFGERGGTTTNLEGRVSRLNAKVTSKGTSRPDWMIAVELAYGLGADLGFESIEQIWDEIERLAPSHRGITAARLASPEGLDGIVAGDVEDAPGVQAPPAESETDSPGTFAVESYGDHGIRPATTGDEKQAEVAPESGAADTGASPATGEAIATGAGGDEYAPGAHDRAGSAEAQAKAAEGEREQATDPFEPSGGDEAGPPRRPPLLEWRPGTAPRAVLPAVDSYSLRLSSTRRLYDLGALNAHSPSLAPLAPGAPLRVNPTDLGRLGLASGDQVRVTSSRASLVVEAIADPGVPRGVAAMAFNQPGTHAGDLIDADAGVTDVRVETLPGGGRS